MLVEVKVPQLSESVAEATLVSWHKKAGEYVKRDENLVDIETDKVVLETPAPDSGVITNISKGDGGTVVSREVIATIDTDAKPASGAAGPTTAATAKPAGAAPAIGGPAAKPAAPAPAAKPPASAAAAVMPAAQKIAADNKIDAAALSGSGRGGRVTKGDVLDAMQSAPPAAKQSQVSKPASAPSRLPAPSVDLGALGDRPEQRVPMSRLRARIAERLVQSQATAAILTTFNEVNMQPVMDLRNRYKDKFEKAHGTKLGFMSFFVKAAVVALKRYPVVNASIDGNDVIYHGYYDVGIAVGSPRGLVVPIVRDADRLSLADIEKQIADFGKRAQDGKLTLEELTGGTFSISN